MNRTIIRKSLKYNLLSKRTRIFQIVIAIVLCILLLLYAYWVIYKTSYTKMKKNAIRIQLHKLDFSPPCRAVMMLCDILDLQVQFIDIITDERNPQNLKLLELNPLRSVPVLVDGDLVIQDSNAILQYLVDTYAHDDELYPKDVRKRALVNQKLFFESSILYPRNQDLIFPSFLDGAITVNKQRMKEVENSYVYLESFLNKTMYLAGETMSIADIAAIASVTSLVHITPIDANKYPNVNRWIIRMTHQRFSVNRNEMGAYIFQLLLSFEDEDFNIEKYEITFGKLFGFKPIPTYNYE